MGLTKLTNYPGGFNQGVSIRKVPMFETWGGNVFYVCNGTRAGTNNTGSDSGAGTRNKPFATLQYAISRCVSGNDDVIHILPGHAETLTSATTLAFNVANVTVVGHGFGAMRPTFTFTTANTATIAVSVAGFTIENLLFIGNFLSIASCFTISTAPDFWVNGCEFRDTDATHGFLSIVTTTVSVNSDGLTFTNNKRLSSATTTPGPDIVVANTLDRPVITGNTSFHTSISNNIAALLEHGALVVTNAVVGWNYIYSVNSDTATGAILIKTTATTGSGMVCHNRVRGLDVAAAIMVTAAAVQYGCFDNLWTGDTAFSGFVLPAIATD